MSVETEKLRDDILEAETLLAEGDSSWCLNGDPQGTIESMKRELAELEWLELSIEH